jgi:hypothetical protein
MKWSKFGPNLDRSFQALQKLYKAMALIVRVRVRVSPTGRILSKTAIALIVSVRVRVRVSPTGRI